MIKAKEARQALKTIAQYCDMKTCDECEIKDMCENLEMKKYPLFFLAEIISNQK
nr:MAG TPA: hypothetical protein [Caudoviricetes sp.]